jgi:ABC-type multidrug transport system fused ATPase/permease subunit
MHTFVVSAAAICAGSLGAGFAARARLIGGARGSQTGGRPIVRLPRRWGAVGLALLRTDRAVAGLAIWLMLVDAALALAAPWPLKVVIDYGLGHGRFPPWLGALRGMSPLALAVAAAAAGVMMLALAGLAGYLVTILSGAIGERLASRLRIGVLGHLLRAVPSATANFPLGELASRLGSDATRVSDTVLAALETLIPDLAVLAGMTIITALVDWRLTLIVLGIIPLYALIARLRNGGLRPAQQDARAQAGKLSALSAGVLARIPAIHVFGRASTEIAAYHQASTAAANAAVSALDASARFGPLTDTLPGLGLAAALIAGTVEISAGRLTVGGLLVVLAYLSSLTGPVRSLAQLSTTMTRGAVSRDRLNELLSLPLFTPLPRSGQLPAISPSTSRRRAGPGAALEIASVSYSHRPGHPTLDAVTLRVSAGEFVCITGPSGAGKSTLLSLVVRLAEPDSGTIRIDGHDIASLPLARLRRLVTLVPQDPWLHGGSIASNIGYGNPAASGARIEAAAHLAGVLTFARDLPGGLDAEVGEHGWHLSGGQQRRVAVARAIAADTPVLLLDEPTTGLDQAAEELLISGLLDISNSKTVVLVTHASRLAALADRVLRLEHGRLAEDMLMRLAVAVPSPAS